MKQNTCQKTSSPLRYNIKRRLAEMEGNRSLAIKRRVRQDCNLTRSSFSRYINERKSERNNMQMNVLLAFAEAFNVRMEDLINH